ncbi:hypothetical protein SAMN05192533_10178 [Mesobacillus persicus]|uniref:Uncharacterized protein n=1 Tax=Mesobacillus persicus TaxID=930146 RepID=A0A1H7VRA3_9BACI|nr:hypothetical protein SAMN05192533_10178 [Mesobacillus persicus]
MTYLNSHCCRGPHHNMHFNHSKQCTCHSHSHRHHHHSPIHSRISHSPSYSPQHSNFGCCCCCTEFKVLTPLKPKKQNCKVCVDQEEFKELLEELVEEILIERFEKQKKKETN